MYSLTCIVLVVSLMYYTFTVSKVIVMRITLHGGASNKIKNQIGSNGPNVFLFSEKNFAVCHNVSHNYFCFGVPSFLYGALFSFIIIRHDP